MFDVWYGSHAGIGILLALVGLLLVICNPIVLTCCYFWYFFRCCSRSSKKKRSETYLQFDDDDNEENSTSSLTDNVAQKENGAYEQARTAENPLTPPPAAPTPTEDDDFADEVLDEQNHLPVRNQSNGMIVMIVFGWASTFTLCFLAIQAPELFFTSLPILTVLAACIVRRCVPDVVSDLEEYNAVSPTEHELGDLAVSSVVATPHDLELIAEDEQQADVLETATLHVLDDPLLTPEQQKEAALEIKREKGTSYQAPNTLPQESVTSETV